MIVAGLLAAASLAGSGAHAQTPASVQIPAPPEALAPPEAPVPVPEKSFYCHTGVKAPSGSTNDKAFFDQVRANCRKGDVLVIPNNDTYRAARLCDFSRSVTATGGHIVCVIAGAERPTR
jgi:hypothetical protein